jgi:catechol 2,3-dioxygenase-like lactoylglutathione lyase family enzyme
MEARAIDHVNLSMPEDRIDEALAFYRDALGFETENLDAYREGTRPLFSFRLGDTCIIHVSPTDGFEPPTGNNFDHVAIVLEASIDAIRNLLDDHGIEIERDGTPLGATGRNPAVYVRDPFGYLLELKEAQDE